ncbi:MAG: IPTL-CTERM sorting domain-containing protein, partial [Deltaproteobacteria bacterium]|nr:IPTL-CTERM sorting domain-containing protein [Deltaproteobacteria bacterium]
ESCDAISGCQAGTPVDPDDGVVCTDDSCDEVNDLVVNAPDDLACDDSDPCTADSCDAITGCGNDPIEGCSVPDVPTMSEWGLVGLAGLLLLAGALLTRERQHTAV